MWLKDVINSVPLTQLLELLHCQETQEALLQLTLHILQHPDTVKQLSVLVQKLANDLSQDKVNKLYKRVISCNANAFIYLLKSLFI